MENAAAMLAVSLAFARLVVEPTSPPPQLADDAVLLVQRHDVSFGCTKPPPPDAGVDAATDAGTDAGIDAGTPDPGCEENLGDAVSMIVRPRFTTDATGARFALLFVTPSRPIVETTSDPFAELAQVTGPRIEIHEIEIPDPKLGSECDIGCSFGGPYETPSFDPPDLGDGGLGDGGTGIETVGPYEIVRASPADPAALAALLDSLGYVYQPSDLDAVAPYLARGFAVVAVRIAIEPTMHGALSPLSLTWAGSELRVPAALGTSGTDGLVVYISADNRYDFPDAAVTFARFTFDDRFRFLTRNQLGPIPIESPDDDPIAVAIPDNPQFQEVIVMDKEVHVPVSDCGPAIGCCGDCNAHRGMRTDLVLVPVVIGLLLLRRRRATSSR